MNNLLPWAAFIAIAICLVPLSQFVQRMTGRRGVGSGAAAIAYYSVFSAGVVASMLLLLPMLEPGLSGTAALGGIAAGIWQLVAQGLFGERRVDPADPANALRRG